MRIARITMFWSVFYLWSMGWIAGIVPVLAFAVYVYEKRLRSIGPLLVGGGLFFGGYYVTWP